MVVRQRWVELPAGCIACGGAEAGRLRVKFRKTSRLCALLGLVGIFIYFSVPAARLHAGLCEGHRVRERSARRKIRLMLWSALACIVVAACFAEPELIVLGIATAIVLVNLAIFYEIVRWKLLKVVHADRYFVWLSNVSPTVLNQLREVNDQADNTSPVGTT